MQRKRYLVLEEDWTFKTLEPICDCCNLNIDCDYECPLSIFISEIIKKYGEED